MIKYQNNIQITESGIDISKVMPIQCIEDDFIINGSGEITAGYNLFLPETYSLSEQNVISIHNSLERVFSLLPKETMIHQQCFIFPNKTKIEEFSNNIIFQENINKMQGLEITNLYCKLYITFSNSNNKNPLKTSLIRRKNYPFSKPYKFEEDLEDILINLSSFENGINSVLHFEAKRMTSEDLNNSTFDFLNLSYDNPTKDASTSLLNPMAIDKDGNLKIGEKSLRIISLIEEGTILNQSKTPEGKGINYIPTKTGMIFPLTLGLTFNHIVNIMIQRTDTEGTINTLKKESLSLNPLTSFYPPAKLKQEQIDKYCNMVTTEENHLTSYTSVNVIVSSADLTTLNEQTSAVKSSFQELNSSKSYIENTDTANLFFASMGGNGKANYRGFHNTIKQALCYLQKESFFLSDKKGHIYYDRFGCPIKLDLWDNPKLYNRNRIMIGPSGTGKSFWLNNYILQAFVQKDDIMIIDIGGSFRSLVKINDGKYYDSSNKSDFRFNPFLCKKDSSGKYNYIDTDADEEDREAKITFISTIISFIWKENKKLEPTEKAILKKSIEAFYKYINKVNIFPNMINYRDYLPEFYNSLNDFEKSKFSIDEISLLLESYCVGINKDLLNSNEEINIVDLSLIAYDMEAIKGKDYFPIVALIVLQLISDKIRKREGIRKRLIIDEAFDFLNDEKFGEAIAYLFRTFRKKEGEILIAAQNVDFIENAPDNIKTSIIINCHTKILLEHDEEKVKALRVLGITEENQPKIVALRKDLETKGFVWREFFIQLGSDAYVLRNEVSELANVAFDSRQTTMLEVKKLFDETGSTYVALQRYIENKSKKIT